MEFEFATATRILFGPGRLRELGAVAGSLGRRALLVTGRTGARAHPVEPMLDAARVSHVLFRVVGEPTVHDVRQGVELGRTEHCDLVVGAGGGSALDAAKAIAALLANPGELFDYLEVVGRWQPLTQPSLPCVAIPTTSGTGAEVTRNAVLASPEHGFKVSLRSPFLLPQLALVDPELSRGLPPALTASTGLDALTQLIEPYVSRRANPLTDGICLEGMGRVQRSLRRAYEDGQDVLAREDMSLASLFGGLALANAGLGAVHGFAAPLGGMSSAPHGAICAALLPRTMEVNIRALQEREPGSEALPRYEAVARVLTGQPGATAEDGVAWVHDLCRSLGIARLSQLGFRSDQVPELIEKAAKASSMKGNPITLTSTEMRDIVEASF